MVYLLGEGLVMVYAFLIDFLEMREIWDVRLVTFFDFVGI